MGDLDGWAELTDANGHLYDPRAALSAIEQGRAEKGYSELWNRLHHQGDIGTAAYAAVPRLAWLISMSPDADWRAYRLVATIEEERHQPSNPEIPHWLREPYETTWKRLVEPALAHLDGAVDDVTVRSILAVLAHAKGQRSLGAIALWTEDERQEALGAT